MKLQNILYVEDEPDIQAVAKLALEMVGGFTVKVCSSGAGTNSFHDRQGAAAGGGPLQIAGGAGCDLPSLSTP